MIRLCVLGEYIIDFTCQGTDKNGLPKYTQNPGGAPANVACAAAKLGTPAGIITKLSNDVFGRFLYSYAQGLGCVDLRGVVRSDDPTGIAFALLDETGERDFVFFRHGCADAMLRPEDIREELLDECSILHFSSVSLAAEPARSATLHAARMARKKGKLVSFDINFRAPLWNDPESAYPAVAEAMALAHIVKASEEEAALFGAPAPDDAARLFLEKGPSLVLITFGSNGSCYYTRDFSGTVPSFPVRAVDTTGAGDNFMGAFLSRFIQENTPPEQLSETVLRQILRYANAAGAICASRYGAIAGQASQADIQEFLDKEIHE